MVKWFFLIVSFIKMYPLYKFDGPSNNTYVCVYACVCISVCIIYVSVYLQSIFRLLSDMLEVNSKSNGLDRNFIYRRRLHHVISDFLDISL